MKQLVENQINNKKASKYDQEIPQSYTVDKHRTLWERATEHWQYQAISSRQLK